MKNKLAGHQPLQDAISSVLADTRAKMKMAAARVNPEVVESTEKVAAAAQPKVLDVTNHEEVTKLAAALEEHAESLSKEADSIENGGESHQGGEQLATMSPVGGKQPYKKDGSKKHQVPTSPGMKSPKDNPGAATAVPTDDERAPGGTGAKYPAKGPLKTASVKLLKDVLAKQAGAKAAKPAVEETAEGEEQVEEAVEGAKPAAKVASAADYILGKLAESEQGGEVLSDDKAGNNPKPAMVPGRSLIQNAQNIKNVTKAQAKAPRKKELAEVLTEPAQTKSTDSKVHENLRNATKGGVKIAAARALLQKIAEEGCTCESSGSCRHCKMTEAAKSAVK